MAFAAIKSVWEAGQLVFRRRSSGQELARFNTTGLIATRLGFGALETPTIASGVLTCTQSFVNPLPESSTSDTVDSIVTSPAAAAGDVLIIAVPATNTITFDDANINLAAATRAVAPGGCLGLYYDGSQWTEMFFLTASDNA